MNTIRSKVWSYGQAGAGVSRSVRQVLEGKHAEVTRFSDLVGMVARLAFHNPEHALFFRGQTREYLEFTRAMTTGAVATPSFLPTIFRDSSAHKKANLRDRYELLDSATVALQRAFADNKLEGRTKLHRFPELAWSVLQHYGVCATPLVDVTQSVRVAASFALTGDNKDGYLYVFGLPHPYGSISYFSEAEMMCVRLLSVCPPEARRPYFQEGFLVGTFPLHREGDLRGDALDLRRRLIAKFRLRGAKFWTKEFPPIPEQALYPSDDRMCDICAGIAGGL